MKHLQPILVLSIMMAGTQVPKAQTADNQISGDPAEQFSLHGALDLFKSSSSPEDFEKKLNSSDHIVNNLDLDLDGEVDYVKVIDHAENDMHALTLQVAVNEKESQDIAVIEIEKTGDNEAMLQIIGDEDVFGKQVIVEPKLDGSPDNAFLPENERGGPSASANGPDAVFVNVWFWPGVRFMFSSGYTIWTSPFRWGYRPHWYHPWRPNPRRNFYSHVRVYYPRYSVVHTHRVARADRFYRPYRSSAVFVRTYRAHHPVRSYNNSRNRNYNHGSHRAHHRGGRRPSR
jgi:hypothetical protein